MLQQLVVWPVPLHVVRLLVLLLSLAPRLAPRTAAADVKRRVKRTPDHTLAAVLHRHLLVVKLGELLEKLRRLDVVQSPAKRKTVSLFSMFVPPFVPSLSW
jgi:hypothetical protein